MAGASSSPPTTIISTPSPKVTAATLWDHQGITESAGILASTSAAVSGEIVIAPYTSGELFALRVQNGQAAWSDMLSRSGNVTALSELDDIAGRPVIDRDVVYAVSHSGVMAAFSLNTGERQWTRDIGGIQTPWVAGDYIYVLDSGDRCDVPDPQGRPRAMDPPAAANGKIPTTAAIRSMWAGPVLVSNRLIVTSSNGYAEAISPYTGRAVGTGGDSRRHHHRAGGGQRDALYLYTDDAELVALR